MSRAWIVVGVVVILAIGLGLGVAGGALLFGDDSGNDAANAAPTDEVCAEAQAAVEVAREQLRGLNESASQDASFFAALIVEQRAITFTMDAEPSCFTIRERAEAAGFLEGVHALLDALGSSSGSSTPPTSSGVDSSSTDSSSTDG